METISTQDRAQLAELPFVVLALALGGDTNLSDEEIGAAQRGLNGLDLDELMKAVREGEHSPTELFELAWLEDDLSAAVTARASLLGAAFGKDRADQLRAELSLLARLVSAASERPLRGRNRKVFVRRVERALGLDRIRGVDRGPWRSSGGARPRTARI